MSETISETAGKVAWFELAAKDTKRAQAFNGGLFGWQFQAYEGQDHHLTFEAGGAIANAPEQKCPMIHFGTDDIDAAIARVRELGGEADDKQEVAGFGHYAYCSDTEGNRFGLYQPGDGE
jgi:predicted enzyme related to lactoylglutathione lyase